MDKHLKNLLAFMNKILLFFHFKIYISVTFSVT